MSHVTIDAAVLRSVQTTFRANYLGGLNGASPIWSTLAAKVSSDSEANEYPFMGDLPRMSEWKNRREATGLQGENYRLKNRLFHATVAVPRTAIEDDRIGLWSPRFTELGKQVSYWPDDLVFEAFLAGTSAICYDGQYFFDTDHPINPKDSDSGVMSNLNASKALTETNLNLGIAQMATLVDSKGNPLNIAPTHLVVPFALRSTALALVAAERNAAGATNVNNGALKLEVNARLDADSATSWYLADLSDGVKPFIFQERVAPEFSQKGTGSEHEFDEDEYVFGARSRGESGYGMWQKIQRNNA